MSASSRRDWLRSAALLSGASLLSGMPAPMREAIAAAPYEDAVFAPGAPPLPAEGAFTVAVLPDTQNYSEKYPATYTAQTEWIVEQAAARRIGFVLHLGDVTNHNTPAEWKNAAAAMSKLDGKVPYALVPGNHDYSDNGSCKDRTTLLNDYFPVAALRKQPTFGGTYDREPDRTENTFHLYDVADKKFIVVGLEFGPRRDVVRWAGEVLAKHRDRQAIMITHAYMYYDETRYDWKTNGAKQTWNPHAYAVAKATDDDVNDGQELWDRLVKKNSNVFLTLNGHVLNDGLGRLSSENAAGRDVHQLLVNFQMKPKGGDGWLRLLEFSGDGKTIDAVDYSPTLDKQNVSPQNKFKMTLRA